MKIKKQGTKKGMNVPPDEMSKEETCRKAIEIAFRLVEEGYDRGRAMNIAVAQAQQGALREEEEHTWKGR